MNILKVQFRICNKCNVEKHSSEFHNCSKSYTGGIKYSCKKCSKLIRHNYYKNNKLRTKETCKLWVKNNPHKMKLYYKKQDLKKLYGLTIEKFNNMLREQNYNCAICAQHMSNCTKKTLYVDHCHKTGKIRKLICGNCNSGLGMFKDRIDLLQLAISYIKEHNNEQF